MGGSASLIVLYDYCLLKLSTLNNDWKYSRLRCTTLKTYGSRCNHGESKKIRMTLKTQSTWSGTMHVQGIPWVHLKCRLGAPAWSWLVIVADPSCLFIASLHRAILESCMIDAPKTFNYVRFGLVNWVTICTDSCSMRPCLYHFCEKEQNGKFKDILRVQALLS